MQLCFVSTDHMQELKRENEKLQVGHQSAQQQSQEATTKLSVLSEYFKEKEVQLQQ